MRKRIYVLLNTNRDGHNDFVSAFENREAVNEHLNTTGLKFDVREASALPNGDPTWEMFCDGKSYPDYILRETNLIGEPVPQSTAVGA